MVVPGYRPHDLIEQRFTVGFDYPVLFCADALSPDDHALAWAIGHRELTRRHTVSVVLDQGLCDARAGLSEHVLSYVDRHRDVLELRSTPHVVPGGEAAKNDPGVIEALHRIFAAERLDRQSAVLIVGGGAVLDAAGYAASTVHRGMRVVRMPSTVLAQNDGGVGVKTGVNAFGAKNFLGTFAPPHAVVNNAALLTTLSLRDTRAGLAEAVKVALIRDAAFFQWIEEHAAGLECGEPGRVGALIRRSANIHLGHIRSGGDPFERDSARPLDYGHWAAHRLEILSGHELRHGEAVGIGMLLDARYAERAGFLSAADLERIGRLLRALGLPCSHRALGERTGGRLALLRGLDDFREHLGGALSVTLLRAIGTSGEVTAIDEQRMTEAVAWLVAQGTG